METDRKKKGKGIFNEKKETVCYRDFCRIAKCWYDPYRMWRFFVR